MNKLTKALEDCQTNQEKAFIPYIMAGDGGLDRLKSQLLFLEKSGATAVELGIPFSDPVADGPVIQQAGIRSLKNGTTLKDVLKKVMEIKNDVNIPIILMGYSNSIMAYGLKEFTEDCLQAGISGCIIPDLPIEEEAIFSSIKTAGILLIRLVTLTSSQERITEITAGAEGFIYAVTVKGITGTRDVFGGELGGYLKKVKDLSPVPVLAGFGISTPDHVRDAIQSCDGVIVGSKIIECFETGKENQISELIQASKGLVRK
ncbi:Tryptophan synthase alpha chain [Peribacillus sp. Bi96]|uniref:tryptophan synthase subunit alpha n=1 Tax=Peribacillus sp. Bi96 TaxID=2884273 RepID=UPI001E027B51|nr:tryptophan synthase subunit alpha [Peribacillus sp. Bi96]CAH0200428.1 Tryptophan synthase alpha chain [Peribacillus sp. Bi96]